jgi:TatD DNase family protein
MRLIDTHVHINFDNFATDLNAVAERWRAAGVWRLVHSCVQPSEFDSIRAIADQFPEIFFAVGLHPLDVDVWHPALADEIRALAQSDHRVVAIGETGLDFFKSEDHERQFAALEAQIEIAQQLNLPLIIHCRDAAAPLVKFLRSRTASRGPLSGVMHCWGGTPEETRWFLDLGFYISFSGTVTFGKAEQIRDSARLVPADRLLVETDCPFLAPAPQRGKRNEPAFVRYVAERLADSRRVDLGDLAAQTTANACRLFGLPEDEERWVN